MFHSVHGVGSLKAPAARLRCPSVLSACPYVRVPYLRVNGFDVLINMSAGVVLPLGRGPDGRRCRGTWRGLDGRFLPSQARTHESLAWLPVASSGAQNGNPPGAHSRERAVSTLWIARQQKRRAGPASTNEAGPGIRRRRVFTSGAALASGRPRRTPARSRPSPCPSPTNARRPPGCDRRSRCSAAWP